MQKKTILITGISSGFGKEATLELLAHGHTVLGALRGGDARWREIAPETIPMLTSKQLQIFDVHLDQSESVNALVDVIHTKFDQKLDVLINNAGFGLIGSLDFTTEEQIRYQMEVNFFAPTFLAKKLYPALKAARGRVINISSIMGLVSVPFFGPYNASKFALEAMSEGMAYDWEADGIQVAIIEPGSFKTDFLTSGIKTGSEANDTNHPKHSMVKKLVANYKSKGKFSDDPRKVSRLIVKYCEQERIPLRTVIGKDAKAMAVVKWLLPESIRFRAIQMGYKKLFLS